MSTSTQSKDLGQIHLARFLSLTEEYPMSLIENHHDALVITAKVGTM